MIIFQSDYEILISSGFYQPIPNYFIFEETNAAHLIWNVSLKYRGNKGAQIVAH